MQYNNVKLSSLKKKTNATKNSNRVTIEKHVSKDMNSFFQVSDMATNVQTMCINDIGSLLATRGKHRYIIR